MISTILVDGNTRLHLPSSQWAKDVQTSLALKGHQLQVLGPAPEVDPRDEAEKARVAELLDSTGL